mgnify:FL=1
MSRAKVEYQDRHDLAEAVRRRAANLLRVRTERKMTVTALALAAEDMAPSYIYEIENGRVAFASLRILDRFAKALGMQPHELLAELDREVPPAGQAEPPRGDSGA